MSVTSFKYVFDSNQKKSSKDDYFNFKLDNIDTSNTQAVKINKISIPYLWSNFRKAVNDVFTISLNISGTTYLISFNLRDTFLKGPKNLEELLNELNAVFISNIQSKLTTAGYGGTPVFLQFLNISTQKKGSTPITLTFGSTSTWGSTTVNTGGTVNPRIDDGVGTLAKMLGFFEPPDYKLHKVENNTGAYLTEVYFDELFPCVVPSILEIRSNYFNRYQSFGYGHQGNTISKIPLGDWVFQETIVSEECSYFNHHPVRGNGIEIDFSCYDDFGIIKSFNPNVRLQVHVEFLQNITEVRV